MTKSSSTSSRQFKASESQTAIEPWSTAFAVARGTPLLAVSVRGAVQTVQGGSGLYTDGNGKTFYLAVDAQGVWRQILDELPQGPELALRNVRLSRRITVLARVGADNNAEDEQHNLNSNRSGSYVRFDDALNSWSEHPQYWAEHPATKVFTELLSWMGSLLSV